MVTQRVEVDSCLIQLNSMGMPNVAVLNIENRDIALHFICSLASDKKFNFLQGASGPCSNGSRREAETGGHNRPNIIINLGGLDSFGDLSDGLIFSSICRKGLSIPRFSATNVSVPFGETKY